MKFILLLLLSLYAWPLSASPVARSAHTEATLLSDISSIQPGQSFFVALRLDTDKDWHTYWQNPGDSGLATRIDWKLPEGFEAGPILWPAPERIALPPLVTYGYNGKVLLLTSMRAPSSLTPGSSVQLSAAIEWLECKEECLPGLARLTLDLPVAAISSPSSSVEEMTNARALLPLPSSDWSFQASRDGAVISLVLRPPAGDLTLSEVSFFPLQSGVIEASAPQPFSSIEGGYQLQLSVMNGQALTSLRGVLVTPGGWRGPGSEKALSIDVTLGRAFLEAPSTEKNTMSLWWSLILAFVGGLILNLMPCVLPVLSIKVLGFVEHAGQAKPWRHGVAFTFGVLLSFWLLAGSLLILRAGGESLGWGFQLQSPYFLVVLCAVLFLFGLNLFGVFEVGTSLTQIDAPSSSAGLRGSFGSGVLATVVATPCTAPFMGAALGYAMVQPALIAMLIFTALGLGMAAPYLLLSLLPGLRKRVPKPGAWMESFKQFMGFLMMATVVWLVWVLGLQTTHDSVAIVLGFLVVLSMAGWIFGRWGAISRSTRSRFIATILALLMSFGGLFLVLSWIAPASATKDLQSHGINWEAFSEERVTELRSQGRPVFIDFTAAWCLSCQVNERVVFSSSEVKEALTRHGVAMLKADWTSRDEKITKALSLFGRSGVPLYVLYGKTPNQAPNVLPELLTPAMVLAALEEIR